jgi:hypothetical protein
LGRDDADTVLALAPTAVQVGRLAALQSTAALSGLDRYQATLSLGFLTAAGN